MGLIKKLGKPITAARPQNNAQRIRQGGGGLAAQSQIQGPPAPFQNPLGSANFQRNRTNDASTVGVGDGRTANTANASGQRPMSNAHAVSGAGYKKPVNYANYAVHDPAHQSRQVGTRSPRGRQASEVTRGRNTTGRKQLVPRMTDNDFLEGAAQYRREHGGF